MQLFTQGPWGSFEYEKGSVNPKTLGKTGVWGVFNLKLPKQYILKIMATESWIQRGPTNTI